MFIGCIISFLFRPALRQYLMDGDFFLGAALSTSLTKLALRYMSLTDDVVKQNVSGSRQDAYMLLYLLL